MLLYEIIEIYTLKRDRGKMCSKEDGLILVALGEQEWMGGIKRDKFDSLIDELKMSVIKGQSSRDYIITGDKFF